MAGQICRKTNVVFLSMLLLVVSNAKMLADRGVESFFEYGAYFLLLCVVWWHFAVTKRSVARTVRLLALFVLVSFLFSIGIMIQSLALSIRLRLVATMLVISSFSVIAEDCFSSLKVIRAAAYGLFAGTLVTTLLSLVSGTTLLESVYEGFFQQGFNGGIQYKNYYAALLLGSFMGLFFYRRYGKKVRYDLIVMGLQVVLIFFSAARGAYIFLVVFLLLAHVDKFVDVLKRTALYRKAHTRWYRLRPTLRIAAIVLLSGLLLLLAVVFYKEVVLRSSTYSYRFRGVTNYLRYLNGDLFRILFGDAAMAWSRPDLSYVETLRQIVGYDGTYEMGFINTLIKNGVVGLIGYGIVFVGYFRALAKATARSHRMMLLPVLGVLLLSALLESFICNIHGIFGMYCYLLLTGLTGMVYREDEAEATFSLLHFILKPLNKIGRENAPEAK